jgi:hypothetical protein
MQRTHKVYRGRKVWSGKIKSFRLLRNMREFRRGLIRMADREKTPRLAMRVDQLDFRFAQAIDEKIAESIAQA